MLALLALLVRGALTLNASFGADRYVTLGLCRSRGTGPAPIVGSLLWMGTIVSGLLAGPGGKESPAADVPGEGR